MAMRGSGNGRPPLTPEQRITRRRYLRELREMREESTSSVATTQSPTQSTIQTTQTTHGSTHSTDTEPAPDPSPPANSTMRTLTSEWTYPPDSFLGRLDTEAIQRGSARWSNLPELVDLSQVETEQIPEDLFAPPEAAVPTYIEAMGSGEAQFCRIILVVFNCGYYAFYTVVCTHHWRQGVASHGKPTLGICQPLVMKDRYHVPGACGNDFCPVCRGQHFDEPDSNTTPWDTGNASYGDTLPN